LSNGNAEITPLAGKRVLVTRPRGQGDEFAAALRDAGAQPVLAPLIAFAPPDDVAAAEQAAYAASSYAWIVFTSANGVRAFFELLDARREDARFLGTAKVAAIGSMTARALQERCIYADLVPRSFVAEDLAQALLAATAPGDAVLVFRAQEARDVLRDVLAAAGRNVDVVAGYKTTFLPDPQLVEKVRQCDAVTFTSASTVHAFADALGGEAAARAATAGKIVACIGPVTAAAARDAGLDVSTVAEEYTANGLLDALRRAAPR
jgi:uroporphyrinogen III methyltransferase/synthase